MDNSGPYFRPEEPATGGWTNASVLEDDDVANRGGQCDQKTDPVTLDDFEPGDSIVVEHVGTGGEIRCYDPASLLESVRATGLHPLTRQELPQEAADAIGRALGVDDAVVQAPPPPPAQAPPHNDMHASLSHFGYDHRFGMEMDLMLRHK